MKKFFNDNMFVFVLLALAAAVVALVFAIGNKKKIQAAGSVSGITSEERAKLARLVIDDQGNVSGTSISKSDEN